MANRIIPLLILLTLFSACSYAANKPKLLVGVNLRPVFQYIDNKDEYAGLDIELARAIAHQAGYELEMIDFPWPRILYLIESGDIDLALSAFVTAERRQFAHFSSQHFRLGHNMLFVKSGEQARFRGIQNLSQLNGKALRIGVQRGASYSDEYKDLVNQHWFSQNLHVVDDPLRKIELLLIGRVDAFIGSEVGIKRVIKNKGLDNQIEPAFYLQSDQKAKTYIIFSKKSVSPSQVDDFDRAILELRQSGAYQRIQKRYQVKIAGM